jgi:hypothetical protein
MFHSGRLVEVLEKPLLPPLRLSALLGAGGDAHPLLASGNLDLIAVI